MNVFQINAEVDTQRKKYQPSRLESFFAVTKSLIIRGLLIYFISSLFRRAQTDVNSQSLSSGSSSPHVPAANIFENGILFDLHVYISESEVFKQFDDPKALIWSEKRLEYGDWYSGSNKDGTRVQEYTFVPSNRLKNNGSIYLHVYVTKHGKSPNPKAGRNHPGEHVSYTRKLLNKFKKIRYEKKHNLLTGQTTATEEEIRVNICSCIKYL